MFTLPGLATKAVPFDEHKHPRDAGKFAHTQGAGAGGHAAGGAPPAKPASHKDTYRALLAQAKATRRAAHAEAHATARAHHEAANAAHAALKHHSDRLAFYSDDEDHDWFRQVDELASGYDPDAPVAERFDTLRDITTAAGEATDVDVSQHPDFTPENHAENLVHLAAVLHHAKEAREHLRKHAEARREARAVRSPDWLDKMFRLPWLVTKAGFAGRFEESKHPRGNPKNPGQFRSGGGGGSTAGPSRTPRMGIFVSAGPSKKRPAHGVGHVPMPPPLPSRRTGARPAPPGTGEPPDNLGHPKTPQDATDHIIWLLGRASILRRQAREGKPLDKKRTRELTMAVNLAGRLASGVATPTPLGGEKEAERLRGRHGPASEPEREPEREPEQTAAPQHTAAPARPPAGARHNPDLDAAFAAAPRAKPAAPPASDMRANPDLDEAFGLTPPRAPADRPAADRPGPAKKPRAKRPRGKKALEKDATAKAGEHLRLAHEADRTGDRDAARHHTAAASLYHAAAEHHSNGNHKTADALRRMAADYAARRRRLSAAKALFRLPNFVAKS